MLHDAKKMPSKERFIHLNSSWQFQKIISVYFLCKPFNRYQNFTKRGKFANKNTKKALKANRKKVTSKARSFMSYIELELGSFTERKC